MQTNAETLAFGGRLHLIFFTFRFLSATKTVIAEQCLMFNVGYRYSKTTDLKVCKKAPDASVFLSATVKCSIYLQDWFARINCMLIRKHFRLGKIQKFCYEKQRCFFHDLTKFGTKALIWVWLILYCYVRSRNDKFGEELGAILQCSTGAAILLHGSVHPLNINQLKTQSACENVPRTNVRVMRV